MPNRDSLGGIIHTYQKYDPINLPAPTQPPPGGVQQKTRPFYVEGAVVAALCGGAVFVVCRSSGRQ